MNKVLGEQGSRQFGHCLDTARPNLEPVGPRVASVRIVFGPVRRLQVIEYQQQQIDGYGIDELTERDPFEFGTLGHVVLDPVEVLMLLAAVIHHLAPVAAAENRALFRVGRRFALTAIGAELAHAIERLQVQFDLVLEMFPRVFVISTIRFDGLASVHDAGCDVRRNSHRSHVLIIVIIVIVTKVYILMVNALIFVKISIVADYDQIVVLFLLVEIFWTHFCEYFNFRNTCKA